MEHGADGGGGSGGGGEEMGGRKVKIHFETHFQLGVHKLLSEMKPYLGGTKMAGTAYL